MLWTLLGVALSLGVRTWPLTLTADTGDTWVRQTGGTPTHPTAKVSTVMSPIVNFTLENLSVSVGATIRWENQDAAPHTSTSGVSPTKDGIWDSGNLNTGQTFDFTFQNAGVFPYWCTVHPFMTATITVTQ